MAYLNKTINDGPPVTFMADPGGSALAAYRRCKFADPAGATLDGKPILSYCSATERAQVVTMAPIAVGLNGQCRFASAAEQFGICAGNVASAGVALYGASNGRVSTTSGGGAVLVGYSTSPGADGGVITYTPAVAAA